MDQLAPRKKAKAPQTTLLKKAPLWDPDGNPAEAEILGAFFYFLFKIFSSNGTQTLTAYAVSKQLEKKQCQQKQS